MPAPNRKAPLQPADESASLPPVERTIEVTTRETRPTSAQTVRPSPRPAPPPPKKQPEKKFGPYRNGVGVTIWLNEVQTEDGPRLMRSITIAPRRYWDREREEWRDAKSYHPRDLVLLLIALQQAIEYVFTTPVPGEKPEDDDTPF